ncbi:MAG: hypothetical protein AB7P04_09055 [Bacteriovoracia bacterium]
MLLLAPALSQCSANFKFPVRQKTYLALVSSAGAELHEWNPTTGQLTTQSAGSISEIFNFGTALGDFLVLQRPTSFETYRYRDTRNVFSMEETATASVPMACTPTLQLIVDPVRDLLIQICNTAFAVYSLDSGSGILAHLGTKALGFTINPGRRHPAALAPSAGILTVVRYGTGHLVTYQWNDTSRSFETVAGSPFTIYPTLAVATLPVAVGFNPDRSEFAVAGEYFSGVLGKFFDTMTLDAANATLTSAGQGRTFTSSAAGEFYGPVWVSSLSSYVYSRAETGVSRVYIGTSIVDSALAQAGALVVDPTEQWVMAADGSGSGLELFLLSSDPPKLTSQGTISTSAQIKSLFTVRTVTPL